MDYAKEASSILEQLPEIERNEIPVKIYQIAKEYTVDVLVRKEEISIVDGKKIGMLGEKAFFTSAELMGESFKDQGDDFLLFLNTDSAMERRLLTAYYIALLHCFFNEVLAEDDAKEALRKARILDSLPVSNDPIYILALYLLIPESTLDEQLRNAGYNYKEALEENSFIEQISKKFLVSKLDVTRRLEVGC